MFCLWMCLSLICALQSSVSSDEGVSLTCNRTVNVTLGENATLRCFINWTLEEECTVLNHVWCDRNGTKLCSRGSTKYICDSDLSDLSLTVLNVQEEESFTVEIRSNCGMEKSHPIRVQLLHGGTNPKQDYRGPEEESAPVTTILLCVFAPVAAVVVVCFLCRAYRRRVNRRRYDPSRSEDSV